MDPTHEPVLAWRYSTNLPWIAGAKSIGLYRRDDGRSVIRYPFTQDVDCFAEYGEQVAGADCVERKDVFFRFLNETKWYYRAL